ncbi:MAG: hypothetical protein ACLGI3_11750, partial [Actinomycetes bacterium]
MHLIVAGVTVDRDVPAGWIGTDVVRDGYVAPVDGDADRGVEVLGPGGQARLAHPFLKALRLRREDLLRVLGAAGRDDHRRDTGTDGQEAREAAEHAKAASPPKLLCLASLGLLALTPALLLEL